MKQVKLYFTKFGRPAEFTLVDDEDYPVVIRYKWYAMRHPTKRYARATVNGKLMLLHQFLLPNTDKSLSVDHINGNGLDNQKENLRLASKSQQGANVPARSKFGFKGVTKEGRGFKAELMCKGIKQYIGNFPTKEQAALAYNKEAVKMFGEFAKLNQV